MSERIRGDLGERMTEAALRNLLRPGGLFGGWEGGATDLGVTWPRGLWRSQMRSALEAAFEELLREPKDPDHAR